MQAAEQPATIQRSAPPLRLMHRQTRSSWWQPYVSMPALMWFPMFAAITAGPWVFRHPPAGLRDLLHWARAAGPLLVFVLGVPFALTLPRSRLPGPLKLWVCYGLIGLGAGSLNPQPLDATYWAICYLSPFVVVSLFLAAGPVLEQAVRLNQLTWFIVTLILGILVLVARDILYDAARTDMSAYTAVQRAGGLAGVSMPLPSGFARFASVPAIVAFVALWSERRWLLRAFWASVFSGSVVLVYMMQSRGAAFSLAFALLVAVYLLGARVRVVVLLAVVLVGGAVAAQFIPQDTLSQMWFHISREETAAEVADMSGRWYYWQKGLKAIGESPLVGWGFQADRALGIGHVHDTYLYALLTAGLLGTIPFVIGLVWAWCMVIRIHTARIAVRLGQQETFVITAAILAFFTARSIPEVCGALFMIDQLVMLPAIAYLVLSGRAIQSRNAC